MFEVGQRVWDVTAGEGVVLCTRDWIPYKPVVVRFKDEQERTYSVDGKRDLVMDENPSLYPYPVEIIKKDSKPSIDWEHVRSKFRWIAQDAEGGCWLYEERPDKINGEWVCSSGDCTSAEGFVSLAPGTCDWKDSLIERP
jgi:hypothetical protein